MDTIIAERIRGADRRTWMHPHGTQTRHLVIDSLLPKDLAYRIYTAFPVNARWHQHDSFRERKKSFAKVDTVDPLIADITDAFHKPAVLDAVKEVTGLADLEADPSLYAGGISMMGFRDFLNPHIDNSHDAKRQRYRRLNLLYYISPDWSLNFGGNLELWDNAVTKPVTIHSAFNRLVIMETNRHSWHSVEPVTTNKNRCCVSNYYFSAKSPTGHDYYHVTSFLGRPGETAKRIYGRADNFMRQTFSALTGMSRGKKLTR